MWSPENDWDLNRDPHKDETQCGDCGEWFYGNGPKCGGEICRAFEEPDDDPCHDWEDIWRETDGNPHVASQFCLICNAKRIIESRDGGDTWTETSFEPGDGEAAYEGDE